MAFCQRSVRFQSSHIYLPYGWSFSPSMRQLTVSHLESLEAASQSQGDAYFSHARHALRNVHHFGGC